MATKVTVSASATKTGDTRSAPAARDKPVDPAEIPGYHPPTSDKEFEYDGTVESVPEWANKSWSGAGLLHVPMMVYPQEGEVPENQAYHTAPAQAGDKVKWVQAKRQFEIVRPEPEPIK